MENMDRLYGVLESTIALCDRLLEVENRKLDAIAVNDIGKLDEHMRAEQACTMELRSLDAKRERVLAELGMEGYTLSRVIKSVGDDDAAKLGHILEVLREKTEDLTTAVDCTRKFIELHLQSLDFVLERIGERDARETSPYEATGEKREEEDRPSQFSSRKV